MTHFFRNLLQGEPHSLVEIRNSLEFAEENKTDLISLLEEHHDFLEESMDVLMDDSEVDSEKQIHLARFFRLLEMHGKAEEETVYHHLKVNADKEARLEGFGGQDEHDILFLLEDELIQMGYQTKWSEEIAAKAKVIANLMKNHIKAEENDMLPLAEKDFSDAEFEILRVEYLEKCKNYLDTTEFVPIQGAHTDSTSSRSMP